MLHRGEATRINDLILRLTETYADVATDEVARAVDEAVARFEDSPIREFVPLLVERRARAVLAQPTGVLVGAAG